MVSKGKKERTQVCFLDGIETQLLKWYMGLQVFMVNLESMISVHLLVTEEGCRLVMFPERAYVRVKRGFWEGRAYPKSGLNNAPLSPLKRAFKKDEFSKIFLPWGEKLIPSSWKSVLNPVMQRYPFSSKMTHKQLSFLNAKPSEVILWYALLSMK